MPSSSVAGRDQVRSVLTGVLQDAARLLEWEPGRVDFALRVLRRARLLGRVAARLQTNGLLDDLPTVARDQLLSALLAAEARQRAAFWELDRLDWALAELPDVPLIAMKGCAYALAGTPNAAGRQFADVDLMVPESHLPAVEMALRARGWVAKELTPYDDQYYRRWAHELPPLTHVERELEVDLHHNILMRTARLKPSAEFLLHTARQVPRSRFKVLAPVDMVLHAMVHLFYGGEMDDALRELVDIDDLLRHFGATEPGFWGQFRPRTEELGLTGPAFYGLRYTSRLLGTTIPQAVITASGDWAPPVPALSLMDLSVPKALFPCHPDLPDQLRNALKLGLYARSHWVKMPPAILARHLTFKAWAARG